MQRRTLLRLGLAGGTLLALAGTGAALWTPGWRDGHLSAEARSLWQAVAQAVLEGVLPADPAVRRVALQAHLGRLDTTIAGLPPATRRELSDLLALLCMAPGRLALTGLRPAWDRASTAEVAAMLQSLRTSERALQRQIYQALRDLSNAAWFADAGAWSALGYPGPTPL